MTENKALEIRFRGAIYNIPRLANVLLYSSACLRICFHYYFCLFHFYIFMQMCVKRIIFKQTYLNRFGMRSSNSLRQRHLQCIQVLQRKYTEIQPLKNSTISRFLLQMLYNFQFFFPLSRPFGIHIMSSLNINFQGHCSFNHLMELVKKAATISEK